MTISHANVERAADSLVVTWRGAPDASVFLSDTPDDAGVDVRAPDAPGVATLDLADPTRRYYVHLFADGDPFVVVAERRLALAGPHNVRDLGGYDTPDGPTRWGRVYRSDNPGLLTVADVAYLERLGIDGSCDFRSDREVEGAPSTLATVGSIGYERQPISTSGPNNQSVVEMLMTGKLTSFSFDDMADAYGRMLHNHSDKIAFAIRRVADPTVGPTLFNCSGGKDRTGLTAALLLSMVGVDETTILDDYELSNRYLPENRLEKRYQELAKVGVAREDVQGMFSLRRVTMATTLEMLRDRHGSVESYLRGHMGLDDAIFDGVRTRLLADA